MSQIPCCSQPPRTYRGGRVAPFSLGRARRARAWASRRESERERVGREQGPLLLRDPLIRPSEVDPEGRPLRSMGSSVKPSSRNCVRKLLPSKLPDGMAYAVRLALSKMVSNNKEQN